MSAFLVSEKMQLNISTHKRRQSTWQSQTHLTESTS